MLYSAQSYISRVIPGIGKVSMRRKLLDNGFLATFQLFLLDRLLRFEELRSIVGDLTKYGFLFENCAK